MHQETANNKIHPLDIAYRAVVFTESQQHAGKRLLALPHFLLKDFAVGKSATDVFLDLKFRGIKILNSK